MRGSLVLAFLFAPALLAAQLPANTVSPGMTKAQVITALGEPMTLRTASDFSYLFYRNACGKQCGMNDLVVLHGDSVVDAIFRSPDRHYTGKSSSPAPIAPSVAAQKGPAGAGAPMQMKSDSTAPTRNRKMKPGKANDIHPSMPVNPPTVKPAGTSKSAPPKQPASNTP